VAATQFDRFALVDWLVRFPDHDTIDADAAGQDPLFGSGLCGLRMFSQQSIQQPCGVGFHLSSKASFQI
jgi:hypothetical protein